MVDGDTDEKDITKRKKFRLDKFGKLFKSAPVVPLFGDMPITLSSIYARAPHIGVHKWESPEDIPILDKSYNIVNSLDGIKSNFLEYVALFNKTFNEVKKI